MNKKCEFGICRQLQDIKLPIGFKLVHESRYPLFPSDIVYEFCTSRLFTLVGIVNCKRKILFDLEIRERTSWITTNFCAFVLFAPFVNHLCVVSSALVSLQKRSTRRHSHFPCTILKILGIPQLSKV